MVHEKVSMRILEIKESEELLALRNESKTNDIITYVLFLIDRMCDNMQKITDENEIKNIYEYYMKPLIEHYVNFINIKKYGIDYILLLIIDGTIRSKWLAGKKNLYLMFGEAEIVSKNSKDIYEVISLIYEKINNQKVKALYKVNPEQDYKSQITMAKKRSLITTSEKYKYNCNYIQVLYDIVNKTSHSNPYNFKKSKTDINKSFEEIFCFINHIVDELEDFLKNSLDMFDKIILIPSHGAIRKRWKKKIKVPKKITYKTNSEGFIVLIPKIRLW